MPTGGKKRKAETSTTNNNMWTSPSPGSNANSSGSSSRRGGNKNNKGGTPTTASSSTNDSTTSTTTTTTTEAEKLWEEICDDDNPTTASMEGICKLCEEINLDPIEDVRVLVLLYKLGANKKPAEIQKEEWIAGCYALNLDNIDKFIKFIPQLDIGFMDREEFGDFYKFCFQFNRAGTHKTLDKDLAIALLRLCLTGSGRITHERLDSFCAYLEATTAETHSKITLDQWRSYLDFSYEYPNEETLGNYDEGESAWPVLIDEYCDYLSKMKTKK